MSVDKEEVQTEGETIEAPEVKKKTAENLQKVVDEAEKVKKCSSDKGAGDTEETIESTKDKNGASQETENVNQNTTESSEADLWESIELKGEDESTDLAESESCALNKETDTKLEQRILDEDIEQILAGKRALDKEEEADKRLTKTTKNLEEFDELTGDSKKPLSDDS